MKKRSTASAIAIVVCVVSLLVGVHVSVGRQAAKVEAYFEDGVYYDGYLHPSVSAQLEDREDAALGIVSVITEYDELSDVSDEFIQARRQLVEAEDGTIYEKYTANLNLQSAYEKLMSAMDNVALSSDDAEAMDKYTETMNGTERLIADSGYNMAVSEFNRDILGSFPVSILRYPAFVDAPDYFGAEG